MATVLKKEEPLLEELYAALLNNFIETKNRKRILEFKTWYVNRKNSNETIGNAIVVHHRSNHLKIILEKNLPVLALFLWMLKCDENELINEWPTSL